MNLSTTNATSVVGIKLSASERVKRELRKQWRREQTTYIFLWCKQNHWSSNQSAPELGPEFRVLETRDNHVGSSLSKQN